MNISKETTLREVCEIMGISEYDQRRCGVNLTAIRSNGIDLGCTLYSMPTMEEALSRFQADMDG